MTQLAHKSAVQEKHLATAGDEDLHPVQWGIVSTGCWSSAGGDISIGPSWYWSAGEMATLVLLTWPPFLASVGTMEVILDTWSELRDLVDRVEFVAVDIEFDDWLVDLVLLDVLLSQASNTLGQSGEGSIVVTSVFWNL